MTIFSRGQKARLADLGCGPALTVTVELEVDGAPVDLSCFGLDGARKLSDDRYLVFYNQLASPGDAIRLAFDGAGRATFAIDLDRLPASIETLVFTAAIDADANGAGPGMGALRGGALTLDGAVRFPLDGADYQQEKALMLAELYRKDGQWRFGAVGQGFNGGMAALLAHFGGTEMTVSEPAQAQAPAPPPKVSLSKVTLEKRGDKVSLEKSGGADGYGRIHVNLNWNRDGTGAGTGTGFGWGFGKSKSQGLDLDLGCMYEMADGTPGVVQALGNAWGDFDDWPYISLAADDRTGAAVDGENLGINGRHFDQIRRALIFAFIYEGAPNWAKTDGVVTLTLPNQPQIEVRMDQGGNQTMCAVAMLENRDGKLQVTKLAEYFAQQGRTSTHELMGRHFGFPLKWVTGSKD